MDREDRQSLMEHRKRERENKDDSLKKDRFANSKKDKKKCLFQ